MDSLSSRVKRQTWIQSSRDSSHSQKVLDLPTPQCDPSSTLNPSTLNSSIDTSCTSVYSNGCSDGKIESWLRGCGMGAGSQNSVGLNAEPTWRTSCDDDLSLGADAFEINHGDSQSLLGLSLVPPPGKSPNCSRSTSTPRQKPPSLDLGNSIASSCPSFSTVKTASNVSEVLHSCSEDAEETLLQLGFGRDVLQAPARVPTRFFTFPSQLHGINFRLFLQSQLQRIREEDPNLTIASRFRQVEVLTAMANAFYSLYSHVSRTPLPKLAPPEPSLLLSPVEKLERFRGIGAGSSVRAEPRSPVERLKDTVSKMCLYTGGASPLTSPKKRPRMPEVVDSVLENAKLRAPKKLDFQEPPLEEEELTQSAVPRQRTGHAGRTAAGTSMHWDSAVFAWSGGTSSGLGESREDHLASCSSWGEPASPVKSWGISDEQGGAPSLDCDAATDPARRIRVGRDVAGHWQRRTQSSLCSQADADANLSGQGSSERKTRCRASAETSGAEGDRRLSYCSSPLPVTGGAEDRVSSVVAGGPQQALSTGPGQHLGPLRHPKLKHISNQIHQGNSFEMEEVSSAGEEDFGQSESKQTTTQPQRKAAVARGDSLQSDSSGYADDEVCPPVERGGS